MAKKGQQLTQEEREEKKAENKKIRAERSAQRSKEWRVKSKAKLDEPTRLAEGIDLTTTLTIRTQVSPSAVTAQQGVTISQELGSFSQSTCISPPISQPRQKPTPSYSARATRSSSRQSSITPTQASGSSRRTCQSQPRQDKVQQNPIPEDQVDNLPFLTESTGYNSDTTVVNPTTYTPPKEQATRQVENALQSPQHQTRNPGNQDTEKDFSESWWGICSGVDYGCI